MPGKYDGLRTELIQFYGEPARRISTIVPGVNHTVAISFSGETKFGRLYRNVGRRKADILLEHHAMEQLKGSAIPVSVPVRGTMGGSLTRVTYEHKQRWFALFTRAPGRELQASERDLKEFGSALGTLHKASISLRLRAPRTLLHDFDNSQFNAAMAKVLPEANASLVGEQVRSMQEDIAQSSEFLSSGFCHGDARLGNARIIGKQVSFFDFDDCTYAPHAFDLATLIWWLVKTKNPDWILLSRSFLEGYRSIHEISVRDIATLPYMALINEVRAINFLVDHELVPDDLWKQISPSFAEGLQFWSSDEMDEIVRHLYE